MVLLHRKCLVSCVWLPMGWPLTQARPIFPQGKDFEDNPSAMTVSGGCGGRAEQRKACLHCGEVEKPEDENDGCQIFCPGSGGGSEHRIFDVNGHINEGCKGGPSWSGQDVHQFDE